MLGICSGEKIWIQSPSRKEKEDLVVKKKRWFSILIAVVMVFSMIPATALADETSGGRSIDFRTFLKEVESAGYAYDGQGVTVEWRPSSACTDGHPDHSCLLAETDNKKPDGNNPQRGQAPNAQYQIFRGKTNVEISNVNFKFIPADFTLCMNSEWRGSFLAKDVKNAELQMLNTGDVNFSGCSFDGVIASPFGSRGKSTFENCDFKNVYDAYAIKDIYSPDASITDCTFDNCGGGIYFEGNTKKDDIVIENNEFTDIDTNAAKGKEFTRGLIQFSAQGNYSNADITIAGNTSTGEAAAVRQLNTTITSDKLNLDEVMEQNEFEGNILPDSSFGTNTVYYNGKYYATLQDALTGVYMSSPQSTALIYCKPGADVGTMTHGHVADDIIIYGNGAYVSAGERDLEIDTYKYDRGTGRQSPDGFFLDKDITVKVFDLNGIAAWGQRNTEHTVNLFFENCKNMERIYFTNTNNREGKINITLNNCSFDGSNENLKSNVNTSVYSNAAGDIVISDTTFKEIAVALNINHKSDGVQNITLKNCVFEDCSLSDSPQAESTKTYAAPVRVVAQKGATTNLTIEYGEFIYSDDKKNCGNGDILIGDGRHDAAEKQGIVTLEMIGTKADIMVQKAGYYAADGTVADQEKGKTTSVNESDVVYADVDSHFIVDKHDSFEIVGAKDATCTSEGYTGDKVCRICEKLIEKGTVIAKTAHDFQDGKCTVCGMADPDYIPAKPGDSDKEDTNTPQTGDNNSTTLWLALLLVSGACVFGATVYSRKNSK